LYKLTYAAVKINDTFQKYSKLTHYIAYLFKKTTNEINETVVPLDDLCRRTLI